MIPYLIRRAEETSILTKLQTQTKLLNEELYERLKVPGLFFALFFLVVLASSRK